MIRLGVEGGNFLRRVSVVFFCSFVLDFFLVQCFGCDCGGWFERDDGSMDMVCVWCDVVNLFKLE